MRISDIQETSTKLGKKLVRHALPLAGCASKPNGAEGKVSGFLLEVGAKKLSLFSSKIDSIFRVIGPPYLINRGETSLIPNNAYI